MLTVRVIISEQLMSDFVLKFPKVKSIKNGLIFVGGMRLMTGLSEGNEKS